MQRYRLDPFEDEEDEDSMEFSRAHFRQTHREFQQIGEGTYGVVRLAAKKKSSTRTDLDDEQTAPKDLVVVKYCKAASLGTNLSKEITTMKELRRLKAKLDHGILPLLDYHISNNGMVQWLTVPYMGGGTLDAFSRTYPMAITLPFIWHVLHSVTRGLLFLNFGITFAVPSGELQEEGYWPAITHGDLFNRNILLSLKVNPGIAFSNFPAIVLADFGLSKMYPGPLTLGLQQEIEFVRRATSDLCQFVAEEIGPLHGIAKAMSKCESANLDHLDEECRRLFKGLGEGARLAKHELRQMLLDVHCQAGLDRWIGLVPFADDVIEAVKLAAATPKIDSTRPVGE